MHERNKTLKNHAKSMHESELANFPTTSLSPENCPRVSGSYATAATAFVLQKINYSISNIIILAKRAKRRSSSDNVMASLREKLGPSAVTVLTAMLFWGQVQNYMMRVNLREAKMDSHRCTFM